MGAYFLCRFFRGLLILLLYLFLLTLIYCIVVSHQKNKSYWSIELIISVLLHDTFQLLFILQFACLIMDSLSQFITFYNFYCDFHILQW